MNLVSKKLYACSFYTAFQSLCFKDQEALASALDFWAEVIESSTAQPAFKRYRWKIAAVGDARMLATPTTVTLGGYNDAATPSTLDYSPGFSHTHIEETFEVMRHFTNLTTFTICMIPFPLSLVLHLLQQIPRIQELNLCSVQSIEGPESSPKCHVDQASYPPSLTSLSVKGMRKQHLKPGVWELLVVLANSPTLQRLEIDTVTWKPFYDTWRCCANVQQSTLRLLFHHSSENEHALLKLSTSLKRFVLLSDNRGLGSYRLATVDSYLCNRAKNMEYLRIPPSDSKASDSVSSLSLPNVVRLLEFEGSPQDFLLFDKATHEWTSILFEGEGGFQVLESRPYRTLSNLRITLEDDRELPFVLAGHPQLEILEVTLRKGDLIDLLKPNSLICLQFGFSSVINLCVAFWSSVSPAVARSIFWTWAVGAAQSLRTVRFTCADGAFDIKWTRGHDQRWEEHI
ncbi:hypothetical protein V5O48_006216 [Marasmius crinis-equi]|uniref:Uncharacterized protein n=1 Tax=Marasmius crinis-equi TaxID=585013 RepID=A0ABR3FK55_9AGAR